MDPRIEKLSHELITYSCALKPGEKVLIEYTGRECADLVKALIREAYAAKGLPFVQYEDESIKREILLGLDTEQAKLMSALDQERMRNMDCYISVRGYDNINELSDVPAFKIKKYDELYSVPVHDQIRIPKTRWAVLRYPNSSAAQLSGMSLEAFTDFYFDVCNLDYSKMSKAMEPLRDLMEKTDRVRIKAPGTDLSFSIKGIPAIPCDGKYNIPDGEVYTAPVRDSVNGVITYNTASTYNSHTFENISLRFENGKIMEARANDTEKINEIFDTDPGARYVGEFAIGLNPFVNSPMNDILFDEKINGSIHFTPGDSYEDAPNGNHSSIHWDLVLILRKEWGGGEIFFDDVLIQKDGKFVRDELKGLNPENLKNIKS